jgi:chaperonin GroES
VTMVPAKTIVPLGDLVLIRKVKREENRTPGGIIIPGNVETQQTEGVVLAVGPLVGQATRPPLGDGSRGPLVAGDTVLLGKYSGTVVSLEQQEFLLVREEQVLAVVEVAP